MAITCELREEQHTSNYVLLARINRQEFIENISQKTLALKITEMMADKIATCLWERIEPTVLQALKEGFSIST
jgi:hypothetical protein